jgi:hypothetical protein
MRFAFSCMVINTGKYFVERKVQIRISLQFWCRDKTWELFLFFDTVLSKYGVKNSGAGTRKGTSTKKTPFKPPTICSTEENVTRNFSAWGKREREMYFSLSFIMYGTSFILSSSVRVKKEKYTKLCAMEKVLRYKRVFFCYRNIPKQWHGDDNKACVRNLLGGGLGYWAEIMFKLFSQRRGKREEENSRTNEVTRV